MSEDRKSPKGGANRSSPDRTAGGARSKRTDVGPGKPPKDKRFQKGAPSPNPLGRPLKPKREESFLHGLDNWAATVTAFDNAMLLTRGDDGEPILLSKRELALKRLYQKAMQEDGLAAMKLYLTLAQAAEAQAQAIRARMLETAIIHKTKYTERFERYERAGKGLPDVFPDPRDIVIHPDGTVTVEGPMDIEGRRLQAQLLEHQGHILTAIAALRSHQPANKKSAAAIERKLKRRLKQVNDALPARMRKLASQISDEGDADE